MPRFHRLLANLIFGAHALMGCNAHHAWSHGILFCDQSPAAHADHHGLADHHHGPQAPAKDNPAHPCQHDACSFVKAETVRIDHGSGHIAWSAATLLAEQQPAAQTFHTACEPLCKADFSSTRLYVWHCALLI